ncbi:MAG: hypothetical protein GC165_02935 [Armatimonadetes bacterium]|nr:hypothetical protein [Armatimonadota bacterium]
MPFLPFEAVDSSGKTVRGTLQANSMQDLEMMLIQRGLRLVSSGQAAPIQAAPPTQPRPMQSARPIAQPAPVIRPSAPQPRPQEVARAVPAAAPASTTPPSAVDYHTPELSDKQIYFIFSQFASFFRSGFSASQMIQHTTAKAPPKIHAVFAQMEREVAGGKPLSDAMELRPRTFHPDMVSIVRAGERSGQLGEAYDVIADQAQRSRAFRLPLGYFFAMTPFLIFCGIGGIGIQTASNATIRRQFDADGQLPPVGTLMQEIQKQMSHSILAGLLIALAFVATVVFLKKYPFRMFRHRFGLMMPIGYSRAKSEAIERFSWSMGAMLKGGASPSSSVQIAAGSIPNLALRQKALDALGSTRENESLATVLQRTGLLSPEYVNIAQNGELVGDTPGALASIERAEAASAETKTGGLKIVIMATTTLAMAAFVAIMVVILYKMYATGIIKLMMEQ